MATNVGIWRWIGGLLALISGVSLLSVRVAPERWLQLPPGFGPVASAAMLGFLFCGCAIAIASPRALKWIGVLLVLLGATALIQSISGWLPASEPWRPGGEAFPGDRMSVATAVAFLALGISCTFIPRRSRRSSIVAVMVLLGTAFSLSMIGIAAYLMGMPLWDVGTSDATSPSLLTALGLLWATLGISHRAANSDGLLRFYDEHPDRRILVRAVIVSAMLVLSAGLLTGAIVARNSIDALYQSLAEIRDTNALLLNVAIREAERQGRLVANTAQDEDDDWVLKHLTQTGTDSVISVWEDTPSGVRRMLTGTDSAEPEVAISLDSDGTSQLMWDGRWMVEVRSGSFVAQVGVDGLERLFKYSPELGSSTDVVICARRGHGLVFFPTRLNPKPFARNSRFNVDGDPFPATRALNGDTATMMAKDYRGREVFAAVAPIGNGKLGIVQKIDTAEALAPLRAEFWKAASLTLLLLGIGALLLRGYVHPLVIDLRKAKSEVTHSHAQLQLLAAHLEQAREEEQKRIARDIHDEMGGTLAAIDMHVHQMATAVRPEMGALAGELKLLQALGRSAVTSMRRVVSQLRPTALDDLGLCHAIDQCAAEFEASSGIPCQRTLVADTSLLSDTEATMIFRIVQESFNNIAKHSRADKAEVVLGIVDDALVLQVQDDGRGFDTGSLRADCFGLLGIRERVRIIGASVEIASAPGQGASVSVNLPLKRRSLDA